ncbi:hypothetical protein F5887DRAFT_1127284 [Amanita rubescens]|nr:hypothetical protein F5887DRAFT_1127284 [Amanita rubescens]
MRTSILAFFSLLSSAWAVNVNGMIRWNNICPGFDQLGQSKVILDNGIYAGTVTRSGSFMIPDVSPGTYILSVVAHDFSFDQLRIDIANSSATLEARPYIAGTPLNPPSTVLLPVPLVLTPRQKHAYFVPLGSFNLISMFSNPMMLLMLATACMMLASPYLLKSLDPESPRKLEHDKENHSRSIRQVHYSLQVLYMINMMISHLTQSRGEGSQKAVRGSQGKIGSAKKANKKRT